MLEWNRLSPVLNTEEASIAKKTHSHAHARARLRAHTHARANPKQVAACNDVEKVRAYLMRWQSVRAYGQHMTCEHKRGMICKACHFVFATSKK